MKKKNGNVRTPEEVSMLRNVAPATHSMHIKNTYELNVNVKFSGLDCCSSHPSISVPMTIIPLQDPAVYGFPEPPGFAPINLGFFACALPVVPYNWAPMEKKVEVTVTQHYPPMHVPIHHNEIQVDPHHAPVMHAGPPAHHIQVEMAHMPHQYDIEAQRMAHSNQVHMPHK